MSAVGDRDALCVDLYSTWGRLNGFLRKDAKRIVFQVGPPVAGHNQVWTAQDGSEQIIALGEPVIRATIKDFMDKTRARVLSQVLKQWIELDRENIVNSQAGMHWVIGPETYETNELFVAGTRLIAWIYWSAQNLERCQVNFGRAATALRLTIRNALGVDGERDNAFAAKVDALNAALHTYGRVLDKPSREALQRFVGLRFNYESVGHTA